MHCVLTVQVQRHSGQQHSCPAHLGTSPAAGSANHQPPGLGGQSHLRKANPGRKKTSIYLRSPTVFSMLWVQQFTFKKLWFLWFTLLIGGLKSNVEKFLYCRKSVKKETLPRSIMFWKHSQLFSLFFFSPIVLILYWKVLEAFGISCRVFLLLKFLFL